MDNSTHNKTEILIQYLDGELGIAERENLEKQLSSNPSLATKLENLRLAREVIKIYGIKEKVNSIHREMMQELDPGVKKISVNKRIFRYGLGIAAGILLLIGLFQAYNYFTLSNEKVFASNYRPYELPTFRDSSSSETSSIESAFRNREFSKVVTMPATGNFTVEEHFLRGVSFLEINNNKSAIQEFNKLRELNKSKGSKLFSDEAEFYLALTYLRNGDLNKSLELFQVIRKNPDHVYHHMVTTKLIRKVKLLKWK